MSIKRLQNEMVLAFAARRLAAFGEVDKLLGVFPNPMPSRDLQRCRSLPYCWPYQVAIFFTVLHYLCLVALVSIVAVFAIRPHESLIVPMVIGLVVCLVTWFVAFLRRRMVRCPLCKGTPLLDSRAVTHVRARRLRPLNHGTTAVLEALFTQRFRCMYCGSSYDMLLKPLSSQRKAAGDAD